jgi:hypothetical protein
VPKPKQTRNQREAAIWLALGIVAGVSLWVVAVTLYTRFALIDARHGLGWSLAAAISSAASLKAALGVIATVVVAGLAAAGSARRPGKMTYVAGGLLVLAVLAALFLWGLLSDYGYLNEYRGTSPFPNIAERQQIIPAASAFSITLIVALSSALAAMLGMSIIQGKKDA